MILVHERELECILLSTHLLMKLSVIIVLNSVSFLFKRTIKIIIKLNIQPYSIYIEFLSLVRLVRYSCFSSFLFPKINKFVPHQ